MITLDLPGRMLFLTAEPGPLTLQLQGRDLLPSEVGPLRDDISTDEITPLPSLVFFDERLATHPYTGMKNGA